MTDSLLNGRLVRLVAQNVETEAESIARWDRDSEYMRLLDSEARRLLTPQKVKAEIEQEIEEHATDSIVLSIRTLAEDKLIGFIALDGIRWPHGDTFVAIGLGDRDYWGRGYGTDAMRVMLRYAFMELNLWRVSLDVFQYNPRALQSYLKAGLVVEGRARQMLRRDGRRWDFIYMGILREEWLQKNGQ
jgi:RimJ/RimL family protein N-acetyltransferase